MRKQEKVFSRQSTIIKTIFAIKLDHQTLLKISRCLSHNFGIRVFKDASSSNFDMTLSWYRSQSRLRAEIDKFSSEIALVLRYILIQATRQSWIVPSGSFGIVINKINPSCTRQSHLPTRWKGTKLGHRLHLHLTTIVTTSANILLSSRINPSGSTGIVVNEIGSTFRGGSHFWRRKKESEINIKK